jgi:hypothetical protein
MGHSRSKHCHKLLLMVVGMLLMAEQRNENPANSWHGMLSASYFA